MAFDATAFAQLIRDEVGKVPGVRLGTLYSFISCPFHSERTPSGRVRHDPDKPGTIGNFNCFGCGERATWNEIAAKLGLQQFGKDKAETATVPVTNFVSHEERLFGIPSNSAAKRTVNLLRFPLLSTHSEYAGITDGMWRGYSLEFLDSVGAQLAFDPMYEKYYVLLLVLVRGKEVGYVRAELTKASGKVSYLNKPGPWSLTHGLFPYDYAVDLMKSKGLSTMVLVEGPRDALRLLREGIPACSILGTRSWGKSKQSLLEFAGVHRLITMFDGDEAGKKAEEFVAESCRGAFEYKAVKLWEYKVPKDHPEDKLDPGNCPMKMLVKLKNYLV